MRNRLKNSEFLALLHNSSFLRLFCGRLVTDAGDSIYFIAAMWLVWELTNSPFYTGLAGALVQLPTVLNFLVGPLVDRWQLRPLLLGTQVVNGLGVLVVPLAASIDRLSVWLILLVMPLLTFVNGFVYPAQDAALPQLVERERLTRANSLFSTSLRSVDMVANAVAGALIALIGPIALFVVNAATFGIAAVLFSGVDDPTKPRSRTGEQSTPTSLRASIAAYQTELREGFDYIRGSKFIPILVGAMVVNFAFAATSVVLPAFADSLTGAASYGLLLAGIGGGTLLGTALASFVEDRSLSQVAMLGFPLSGLALLSAVALAELWATVALFALGAAFIGTFNVLFFTLLQSSVDEEFLGRVSSIVRTLAAAMSPIGALVGGALGSVVGSTTVMYGFGCSMVLLGCYFVAHPALRSLPPIAEANEARLRFRSSSNS